MKAIVILCSRLLRIRRVCSQRRRIRLAANAKVLAKDRFHGSSMQVFPTAMPRRGAGRLLYAAKAQLPGEAGSTSSEWPRCLSAHAARETTLRLAAARQLQQIICTMLLPLSVQTGPRPQGRCSRTPARGPEDTAPARRLCTAQARSAAERGGVCVRVRARVVMNSAGVPSSVEHRQSAAARPPSPSQGRSTLRGEAGTA